MIDKNTVLTITFTIVDDIMKEPKIQAHLKRPGVAPKLSDSEVVTLALYQELIGESREDHFLRLHRRNLLSYFPCLNERSRYNRRKRDLRKIILAIRQALNLILKPQGVEMAVIDSAPVPVVGQKRSKLKTDFTNAGYGFCSSKALKYFGYKLHTLVGICGSIVDFVLTSASPYDNKVVPEFLEKHKGRLKEILGDKAYCDQPLKDSMHKEFDIKLYSPRKANQKKPTTFPFTKGMGKLRLMVETVNAQLQEQFHLSKHYAKSRRGLFTRIGAKLTAHTMGILINKLLGRPPLALASS